MIVQALATGAPSIRRASGHDAPAFLEEELRRREELRYPPFSHLVEVALSGDDEPPLDRAAERLAAAVSERLPADAELLGPAPMFRRRGRHRRRLLVKAGDRLPTVDAVREAVKAAVKAKALTDVSVSVDVDPQ